MGQREILELLGKIKEKKFTSADIVKALGSSQITPLKRLRCSNLTNWSYVRSKGIAGVGKYIYWHKEQPKEE